jgi:thiol-disulfide isomerase/thioredoxin
MATTITRKRRSAHGAEALATGMTLVRFTLGTIYPQLSTPALGVRYLAEALKARTRVRGLFQQAVAALVVALTLAILAPARAEGPDTGPVLYHFWSLDCPVCIHQKPWLEGLAWRFEGLRIIEMELSQSDSYHARFIELAEARGIPAGLVPTLILGERAWVGDSPAIRDQVEAAITAALAGTDPPLVPEATLSLPLIGPVDAAQVPVLALTVLIAFVDGFNPCSLWVLTLLLGLVIASGSRRRVAVVGVSFLVTTALIYGAFIAGLFSLLTFAFALPWVRWVAAGFALVFGLVSIKDYFWYRRGLSFSIPEGRKPGIYQRLRRLRQEDLGTPALIGATVVMAAGIALVELPCTAGFPVLWSGILTERGITGGTFLAALAVYVLIYLAIELAIFVLAVTGMSLGRMGEHHGRALKLIGGIVMVALASALAIRPGMMEDLAASSALFAGALALAALILFVRRRQDRERG